MPVAATAVALQTTHVDGHVVFLTRNSCVHDGLAVVRLVVDRERNFKRDHSPVDVFLEPFGQRLAQCFQHDREGLRPIGWKLGKVLINGSCLGSHALMLLIELKGTRVMRALLTRCSLRQ